MAYYNSWADDIDDNTDDGGTVDAGTVNLTDALDDAEEDDSGTVDLSGGSTGGDLLDAYDGDDSDDSGSTTPDLTTTSDDDSTGWSDDDGGSSSTSTTDDDSDISLTGTSGGGRGPRYDGDGGGEIVTEDDDGTDTVVTDDAFDAVTTVAEETDNTLSDGAEAVADGDSGFFEDAAEQIAVQQEQAAEAAEEGTDDVQAMLAQQQAAYEARIEALMNDLPIPDSLGGSSEGGGLSPALGAVALLAVGGGTLYYSEAS